MKGLNFLWAEENKCVTEAAFLEWNKGPGERTRKLVMQSWRESQRAREVAEEPEDAIESYLGRLKDAVVDGRNEGRKQSQEYERKRELERTQGGEGAGKGAIESYLERLKDAAVEGWNKGRSRTN